MTLEEQKLAVCEKLPKMVGLNFGGVKFYWKASMNSYFREINWRTEGLQVCHEAEKLLVKEKKNFTYSHILYNIVVPLDGQPFMATYEQRLEAICRVWWPERFE